MNYHIDITFDMETVATTANAAVMQVAAIAWDRDAASNPFLLYDSFVFNEHVDLRSCVVDGFDFDQQTVQWWSQRSDAAKCAVTNGQANHVKEVFTSFINWINGTVKNSGAEGALLWCQGMDFDSAIFKNICRKYGLQLPVKYQQFRDCRTVILEAALMQVEAGRRAKDGIQLQSAILAEPSEAYQLYDQLPKEYAFGSEAHDALYDAMRSAWNTWQALKWIRESKTENKGCKNDGTSLHPQDR